MIYVDTSAAVKALIREPGTDDVTRLLTGREDIVSSRLLDVELMAVAVRRGIDVGHARQVVDRIALISLDDEVARRAVELQSGLRALDALHLATMMQLGETVTAFVGYDEELTAAVDRHGIRVMAPPFRDDGGPATAER